MGEGEAENHLVCREAEEYIVTFKDRHDYKYYVGQPFSSPFDPAHDAFKKFAIPLLSVDEAGKTNGAIMR
jgi:hypothetical protein